MRAGTWLRLGVVVLGIGGGSCGWGEEPAKEGRKDSKTPPAARRDIREQLKHLEPGTDCALDVSIKESHTKWTSRREQVSYSGEIVEVTAEGVRLKNVEKISRTNERLRMARGMFSLPYRENVEAEELKGEEFVAFKSILQVRIGIDFDFEEGEQPKPGVSETQAEKGKVSEFDFSDVDE